MMVLTSILLCKQYRFFFPIFFNIYKTVIDGKGIRLGIFTTNPQRNYMFGFVNHHKPYFLQGRSLALNDLAFLPKPAFLRISQSLSRIG